MSYSIPVTEDSSQLPMAPGERLVLDENNLQEAGGGLARSEFGRPVFIVPTGELRGFSATSRPLRKSRHAWPSNALPLAASESSNLDERSTDRRDVVSYSQCCNMMQTEDVSIVYSLTISLNCLLTIIHWKKIVNIRCGSNETRRLIFKSAKTCECLFCKHV